MTKSRNTASAVVDVEARSAIDLVERGFHTYVNHKSTVALSIVALFDDTCKVWVNGAAFGKSKMPRLGSLDIPSIYGDPGKVTIDVAPKPPAWLREASKTHTWIGHNATGFDDPFCRTVLGLRATWFDTYPIARQVGLPGGLDDIGKRLLNVGKHPAAKFMPLFFDGTKDIGKAYHMLWAMVSYNICDCLLTRKLYSEIESFIPDAEREVFALHHKINRKGVQIDKELHAALSHLSAETKERAGDEIERLTRDTRTPLLKSALRSVPQMTAWLASNGFRVENMRKETIARLLGAPDDFFVGGNEIGDDAVTLEGVMPVVPRVLRLRAALTRTTESKLKKMGYRASDDDSRMRDMLIYYGAHTGRFSSRVVQLHNMARGLDKDTVDIPRMIDGLKRATSHDAAYSIIQNEAERLRAEKGMSWVSIDDILGTLLRYVLVAPTGKYLGIVDYNAIECRGAGFVANEQRLLSAYREGRDPYREFAGVLFKKEPGAVKPGERFIAKVALLGAQYGLSGGKLALFGANNNVDFVSAGVTPTQCIATYRETYKNIPALWYKLSDVLTEVVEQPGRVRSVGRCTIGMWGGHLIIQLPSGRELCYRYARIEPVMMRWGEMKDCVTYEHHHGYRKSFWYGLTIENIVQAMCRDLLCHAMLELDRRGFDIVLHVHDEIVCEIDNPDARLEMEEVMQAGAPWSDGFPIGVEGHTSRHYGKVAVL